MLIRQLKKCKNRAEKKIDCIQAFEILRFHLKHIAENGYYLKQDQPLVVNKTQNGMISCRTFSKTLRTRSN